MTAGRKEALLTMGPILKTIQKSCCEFELERGRKSRWERNFSQEGPRGGASAGGEHFHSWPVPDYQNLGTKGKRAKSDVLRGGGNQRGKKKKKDRGGRKRGGNPWP